ncbi:MAG: DUF4276 family protein [Bacteroidales bacterium]|nr:DUF4276 family protein [Bacteroidales bacterium]
MIKILHILCEGQTEEAFVSAVLKPHLKCHGIITKSIIVSTSRSGRGGVVSFSKIENDLNRLFKSNPDTENIENHFTTMIDFYALPTDFPNFQKSKSISDPYLCIDTLTRAFGEAIEEARFIPYIQLYEFETLIFCGLSVLLNRFPKAVKGISSLQKLLLSKGENPELINGGYDTSPSHRIIKALRSDSYNYDKVLSARVMSPEIGLERMREMCSHFNSWITQIETI